MRLLRTAGSRARTAAKGAAFDDPDIDMSMFRFWIPPRAFKGEVFLRTLDLPTIESFANLKEESEEPREEYARPEA